MINIIDFGADKNGMTISTFALQSAIDKCGKGDCVYIPKGIYKIGAVFFKERYDSVYKKRSSFKGQ